jgi:hypothetical protein
MRTLLVALASVLPAAAATSAAGEERRPARGATVVGVVTEHGRPVRAEIVATSLRVDDLSASPRLRRPVFLLAEGALEVPGPFAPRLEEAARTSAECDGGFCFDGLAVGTCRLTAHTWQGREGSVEIDVPARGAILSRDIAIEDPAPLTVRGYLRHRDGRSFRGRVAVFPSESMVTWADSAGVETDACGRFLLQARRQSSFPLRIGAVVPGCSATVWTLDRHAVFLDRVVDTATQAIEGTVVDGSTGAPIAGAAVVGVQEREPVERYVRSSSDASGRFRVGPFDAGEVAIVATAAGYGDAYVQGRERLTVRLSRAGRVRGRVRWPAGTAAPADVSVRAWLPNGTMLPVMATARPGADGRFDLGPMTAGRGIVYLVGGGWLSSNVASFVRTDDASQFVAVEPGKTVDVDVVPVRAGTVRGRLTGPDGPVAGAVLRVELDHGAGQAIGSRPPGTEPMHHAVASDADGTYEVGGLIPDLPYRVSVSAVGLAETVSGVVRVGSGGTADADVRLVLPRHLDVTVLERATGRPVRGASVSVSHPRGSESTVGGPSATTDVAGRARLGPLREEAVVVEVRADGYEPERTDVSRPPDGPIPSVAVRLRRVSRPPR